MSKNLKVVTLPMIPDLQDPTGNWIGSVTKVVDCVQYRQKTHGRDLYEKIKARCDPHGSFVRRFPSYKGCENKFTTFNNFMEWATITPGYSLRQPNEKFWAIDKDILVKGNKIYGEEFCCFVPEYVNNCFVDRGLHRGSYPLGATRIGGRSKQYASRCNTFEGREYLGCYDTPIEAHRAWQERKAEHLINVAEKYKCEPIGFNEAVYLALQKRSALILADLNSHTETSSP